MAGSSQRAPRTGHVSDPAAVPPPADPEPRATPPRQQPSRILFELVIPNALERRAPLRRLVGDAVPVAVDLVCDGDAQIAACICYRVPGEPRWRFAPMQRATAAPRWAGSVRLQSGGRYRVSVEAWVDVFATVRERTLRTLETGGDGAAARRALHDVLRASALRAEGQDRELLESRAAALVASGADLDTVRGVCDRQLDKRMWIYGGRQDLVRAQPAFEVVVDRRRAGFAAWWIDTRADAGASASPDDAASARPASLEGHSQLGVDVVCFSSPSRLAQAPRAGAAARVERDRGLVPGVAWARQLGLEVALDFDAAPFGGTSNPHSDIAPPLWQGDRDAAWHAVYAAMQKHLVDGVRMFRLLEPEKQPLAFWRWAVERLKRTHPDAIFVAAGRPTSIQELELARAGISATWRMEPAAGREALEELLARLTQPALTRLLRPHVCVDLSDERAAASRDDAASTRAGLLLATMLAPTCLLCSTTPLAGALRDEVRALLRIRRENRCLQLADNVRRHSSSNEHIVFFSRSLPEQRNDVLVAVNTDGTRVHEGDLEVPLAELGLSAERSYEVDDLLRGGRATWHGARQRLRLDPRERAGCVWRLVRARRLGALL